MNYLQLESIKELSKIGAFKEIERQFAEGIYDAETDEEAREMLELLKNKDYINLKKKSLEFYKDNVDLKLFYLEESFRVINTFPDTSTDTKLMQLKEKMVEIIKELEMYNIRMPDVNIERNLNNYYKFKDYLPDYDIKKVEKMHEERSKKEKHYREIPNEESLDGFRRIKHKMKHIEKYDEYNEVIKSMIDCLNPVDKRKLFMSEKRDFIIKYIQESPYHFNEMFGSGMVESFGVEEIKFMGEFVRMIPVKNNKSELKKQFMNKVEILIYESLNTDILTQELMEPLARIIGSGVKVKECFIPYKFRNKETVEALIHKGEIGAFEYTFMQDFIDESSYTHLIIKHYGDSEMEEVNKLLELAKSKKDIDLKKIIKRYPIEMKNIASDLQENPEYDMSSESLLSKIVEVEKEAEIQFPIEEDYVFEVRGEEEELLEDPKETTEETEQLIDNNNLDKQ